MKSNGKRVLIIADSMAMPREDVGYELTWIYKLKQAFPDYDVVDRPSRGATSLRLVTEGGGGKDLLEFYGPDIVVLQLGMAEAAPRLFHKTGWEYFFINKILPARFRMKYVNWVKKTRGRNPKITEISPDRFKAHITAYFKRAQDLKIEIVALLLARVSTDFLNRSPRIMENVHLYNSIYEEVAESFPNVTLVHPFDESIDMDRISVDEVHVTEEGHEMILNRIKPFL